MCKKDNIIKEKNTIEDLENIYKDKLVIKFKEKVKELKKMLEVREALLTSPLLELLKV